MTDADDVPAVPYRSIWCTARRVREVDEAIRIMMKQGEFTGMYYSPMGQEVLAAAVGACLRTDDYLVTTYRGLHDQIAKGVALPELLAELFGRSSGTCGGKGGAMHVADPSVGVMVTTGIVGAGLPIAVGLALGAKLEGSDRVCAVSFGDGATNIGAFHEALNLAAVWSLPVIFVCQNNEFGEFTPRRDSALVEIADRAIAYGMPGVTVDGNDAEAMWSATREAVRRARAGGGPTLIDAKTYRFMGHYFGDAMAYMDKEELARRMADDPLDRLRAAVLKDGAATAAELDTIEAAVSAEVAEASSSARRAASPTLDDLLTDVYAEVTR